MTGSPSVVLVGDRSAEERHHAVAGELVDRALESVDGPHENREDTIEDAMPLLGVKALGEAHGIGQVGEEHADLLALSLEGALGGEDLFDEVAWGVGTRVAHGRQRGAGRRERRAAGITELLARRVPRSAGRPYRGRGRPRTGHRSGRRRASRAGSVGTAFVRLRRQDSIVRSRRRAAGAIGYPSVWPSGRSPEGVVPAGPRPSRGVMSRAPRPGPPPTLLMIATLTPSAVSESQISKCSSW